MIDSNNEKISASDIENKLKELKDEVYSISGGLSLFFISFELIIKKNSYLP